MFRTVVTLTLVVILVTGCTHPNKDNHHVQAYHQSERKVVVIVVDSLNNQALAKVLQRPDFPAFQYLTRHGHYLPNVVSSFPSMTVSVMSTLVTGTSPEIHHIPGLVWFDTEHEQIINYGNNLRQTLKLGVHSTVENSLYNLNCTHLSKQVRTVFEELQDAGYTTGTINMPIYRGRTLHHLQLPIYARPVLGVTGYDVMAPDRFVYGDLTNNEKPTNKSGVFNKVGFNDEFAIRQLVNQMTHGTLSDFTMVYLPDNDTNIHKHGPSQLKGIVDVEHNLQQVLNAYGNWNETLKHVTLIVMGDGGVTPILPKDRHPTILLSKLFPMQTIHQWGKPITPRDDLVFAVNSRMTYVYMLKNGLRPTQIAKTLSQEKRIDTIAWMEDNTAFAASPETFEQPMSFQKRGKIRDAYRQSWKIDGNSKVLDLTIGKNATLKYGRYPDALQQLWSALHSHRGKYLIVTAKKGYQFGDENAPEHNEGAQQGSLVNDDVVAPMVVIGTDQVPGKLTRFVDLKEYFISLVRAEVPQSADKRRHGALG